MISQDQYEKIKEKKYVIENQIKTFATTYKPSPTTGQSLPVKQLLAQQEYNYETLQKIYPDIFPAYDKEVTFQIETAIKYAGYISRQEKEAANFLKLENICLPPNFAFENIQGLRNESREKLQKYAPPNLLIASKIDGISPSDISILMVNLKKMLLIVHV